MGLFGCVVCVWVVICLICVVLGLFVSCVAGVVSGFSAVWVDLGCWLPGGLLGVVLVSRVCGLLLRFRAVVFCGFGLFVVLCVCGLLLMLRLWVGFTCGFLVIGSGAFAVV